MQPPVYLSSTIKLTRDVEAAGFKIRKGDQINIGIANLCNYPGEWISPEEFIPERFDSSSQYYLTPEGKKRNPFSFSPFLGGMRICLGKTFIEEVSKVTLPNILERFDFALEDPSNFVAPFNNLFCIQEPVVEMILSKRN